MSAEPVPGRPAATLLADHTTLRLGGPARAWAAATTDEEVVDAVRAADESGTPVLLLGGGSNLVVADEGFDGLVVAIETRGIDVDGDACGGAFVTAAAGENWDAFVAHAVSEGWVGVEALSGIPGSVGATPIQNVGAYGQEVADTIARVRTWDRRDRAFRTFAGSECGFGYRDSRFKAEPGRYVVLSVSFQLRWGDLGEAVRYAELARALGVQAGERSPSADVRAAVLRLRAAKGMVLASDDQDTWSAGSFFTNPVLPPEAVPPGAPAWPQPDGRIKTSAAWLIEHAGFGRGYGLGLGSGRVAVSTKHALALTNRGGASTADLLALAGELRDGVEGRFGIRLTPEPVLVGCRL